MRQWMVVLFIANALTGAAQSPESTPATTDARFEVASVRPNRDGGVSSTNTQPGGRFVAVNMPLRALIVSAYGVRAFQLVDVPPWVQTARFDIAAQTGRDEYKSVVQLRPLIQTLLAERFQLTVERERRVLQTYALVRLRPDTLGPELRAANVDCASPDRRDAAVSPRACGIRSMVDGVITGIGVSPYSLAAELMANVDALVDDETGLNGRFDFTLKWAPGLAAGVAVPDGVSIFTAVQEQLGLKLDVRRKEVDVIAIKRIERPTEN